MEETRFESLRKGLTALSPRRGLVSLLGALTVSGALPLALAPTDAQAKKKAHANKKKKSGKSTPGPQGPPGADGSAGAAGGQGPTGPAGSSTCPSGTLLHQGVCIETVKRTGTPNFTTAQSACLGAGRRLPTLAELQTFRLRGGQDMSDAFEHTRDIWTDAPLLIEIIVNINGIPSEAQQVSTIAFRCVAAPS